MTRRQAQAAATKTRVVAAARRLFAANGYAGTSTAMVLTEAGLARGGLYHHFSDKRDLLRAAVEEVERDLLERVLAESYGDHARPLWDRLIIGIRAFLAAAADREVRQIVLTDAPAVLGRAAWQRLDEGYMLGQLKRILRQGMQQGVFPEQPLEPLARLLMAMLNEAAAEIASSPHPEQTLEEMYAAVVSLFERLRT